ncbi:MAG: ADP-forming succinate--CoA ligase subunit beta [bacterium]|nr:ADP-forming succinate--CoA ligase subunit beta [Spirochaetales bacterium]MDT3390640.1 ADP-forming succinate--CoA ligase subunit beta [bacterium]
MKIHEYQAKELLSSYGVPVPSGKVAMTADEAYEIAKTICPCVIKAQVHSGGRGKAGGVKIARTPEEARDIARTMLGMTLVTKQTGPEGKPVSCVLVGDAVEVEREYYLSITGDSVNAGLVLVVCADGGTEIEDLAKTRPEAIVQIPVSAIEGFRGYQGIRAAEVLGLDGENQKQLVSMLRAMTRLYLEKDCSLIEINPLVRTKDGNLMCLDAKINFDDNALFRHPDLAQLRDISQEDAKEYRASCSDLNYVSLDGDIGCLVNGAGLAMATMDIIRNFGGNPANFLDVGGSATTERVKAAFEILLSDGNVKAIFVNIFGGIMKCDIIAEGLVQATREMGVSIPIVVRLEGTNVDAGRRIINESGLSIISASDMADGARKAIQAAKGGRA